MGLLWYTTFKNNLLYDDGSKCSLRQISPRRCFNCGIQSLSPNTRTTETDKRRDEYYARMPPNLSHLAQQGELSHLENPTCVLE